MGALREWSVLIDWARRHSTGPVAVGGTSLGALMSQLAADRAADWPERLRPDAMLLITHCGSQVDAVMRGQLARVWGNQDAIREKGWTTSLIEQYLRLLDPQRPPVMSVDRIVSVIGSRDGVTPFDSGLDLLDRWRLPDTNRFIWRRGHFSVPMTMIRNHEPLRRFREILASI